MYIVRTISSVVKRRRPYVQGSGVPMAQGADCLYPESYFVPLDLPSEANQALGERGGTWPPPHTFRPES